MVDRALQHRRGHNLLLIQQLLGLRGDSSPFTLVLDTVEQSAKPLIRHYVNNAKISKTDVVYISFETLKPPLGIAALFKARQKDAVKIQKEISSVVSTTKRALLVFDTLYPLACNTNLDLPSFLSSLVTPTTSLLAIYHTDIPLPPPLNPYAPSPLTSLEFLATTIFTTHSLEQVLSRKRAADKSLTEPVFGLEEKREGVIIGLGSNDPKGLVLEMNHRRKSGRNIEETFFLPPPSSKEKVVLLEDHPLYRRPDLEDAKSAANEIAAELSTFDLGITAQQRRDREGVVLPYFDAQKDGFGGGQGGRILYDMGVEDDFDEEEDET